LANGRLKGVIQGITPLIPAFVAQSAANRVRTLALRTTSPDCAFLAARLALRAN